ncbi:MAG: arginine--tRNA ligase [Rickettsiales bacterium]|jgi:arginyl-tRNA synthetase|nr:arginine--tRNA ligase [Rickettsiales bacterium]
MNIQNFITDKAKTILKSKYPADLVARFAVETSKSPEHGDYATNFAMIAAKTLGKKPMEVAADLAVELTMIPEVDRIIVAAPGFVNFCLTDNFLMESAQGAGVISPVAKPATIGLEYAGYNIAKALHIGHLSTTLLGDVISRILTAVGHRVISNNFIGDWGRNMGMVIAWIVEKYPGGLPNNLSAEELNGFYPSSSIRAKDDPEYLEKVRKITAEFQDGNIEYMKIYEQFLAISIADIKETISMLDILPFDNWHGERYSAPFVKDVEKILRDKGLLETDAGAEVVRVSFDAPPLLFRTGAGAETYATADLTNVRTWQREYTPDKLVYIVDVRQKLHLSQVFDVATRAGFAPADGMTHIGYGAVVAKGGRVFKTRDGGAPNLRDVINATIDAAAARVAEAGKSLPAEDIKKIGIAALKFNYLSHGALDNFAFDPEQITSFEGHTGPYVLYTAVRLASIMAKAGEDFGIYMPSGAIEGAAERALILQLLEFDRAVQRAGENFDPSIVANFVYDLAQLANGYYHEYPVLKGGIDEAVTAKRKALIWRTHRILSKAIELLGMEVPKGM